MRIKNVLWVPAAALLGCALGAKADPGAALRALGESAASLGLSVPVAPPPAAGAPADDLQLEAGQVTFEYPEMVDRMEKLGRTVIGRGKKKRRTGDTGVTAGDRVERGEISYIVIHASGGAGGCSGSVSQLLGHSTAAHFIVCRDGRITRMVDIANIARHVKNEEIDRASVGIETESGYMKAPIFRPGDWDPANYWRMYASLAWLIRAVAKEANVPRDRDHIVTHEWADSADRFKPGVNIDRHVDPGPYFDNGRYPAFDAQFAGEAVTPREYLMRLVNDDVPPVITLAPDKHVAVRDPKSLGLAHIVIWTLNAQGKQEAKQFEWSAPLDGMPPPAMMLDLPQTPGSYRIVARDLVGNTTSSMLKVEGEMAALAFR
jgi:hypothetical protein